LTSFQRLVDGSHHPLPEQLHHDCIGLRDVASSGRRVRWIGKGWHAGRSLGTIHQLSSDTTGQVSVAAVTVRLAVQEIADTLLLPICMTSEENAGKSRRRTRSGSALTEEA